MLKEALLIITIHSVCLFHDALYMHGNYRGGTMHRDTKFDDILINKHNH